MRRLIPAGEKYDSKIWVLDKDKLITKLDCKCPDFIFRRIKKIGDNADKKFYAEPCKHLQPVVHALKKLGYKLKKPKEMIGSDKLTAKLKRELLFRANNQCENPRCNETENLTFHRKVRGSNGGKYNLDNCMVLCKSCHRIFHLSEFPGSKSR